MDIPFSAYKGDESFVFISYSHADSGPVYADLLKLHNKGLNIYYDEGIAPGTTWRDEIAIAINQCAAVVFFVSSRSSTSVHCEKEINFALDMNKRIILIYIEDIALPPGMRLALGHVQGMMRFDLDPVQFLEKLSATVRGALDPQAPLETTPTEVQGKAIMTLAVLPFANLGENSAHDNICVSVAEDVADRLTGCSGMEILAITAHHAHESVQSGSITAPGSATHHLSGSVHVADSRIRISVRLIDCRNNAQLWSHRTTEPLQDHLFDTLDKVTDAVAEGLRSFRQQPAMQTSEPPRHAEAHDAYLGARYQYNVRLDFAKAIQMFEKAVKLDPGFAQAWAELAALQSVLVWHWIDGAKTRIPLMQKYYRKALELDPQEPTALGLHNADQFYTDRNYQSGLDSMAILLDKYPSRMDMWNTYRTMCQSLRQFDHCVDIVDKMLRFDPLAPMVHRQKGQDLVYAGRYEEALVIYEELATLGYDDSVLRASLAFRMGDIEEAEKQTRRVIEKQGPDSLNSLFSIARSQFLQGDHTALAATHSKLRQSNGYRNLAFVRAEAALLNGDLDEYYTELGTGLLTSEYPAFQNHVPAPIWLKFYPELTSDARYLNLLARAGLDEDAVGKVSLPINFLGS